MTRMTSATLVAALTLPLILAGPVAAKPGDKGPKGAAHNQHVRVDNRVAACPPGLAKKSPACVPPGQAKKRGLSIGDSLASDGFGTRYILVRDPGQYGLDPYGTYYRIDGQVVQVDRETNNIIALIGAVAAILN